MTGFGSAGSGSALDNPNAVRFQCGGLRGVVGHQPHPLQSQVGEDGGGGSVLAGVDWQAECGVRGDGVEPAVLELVRPQLVRQPDPPTFLPEIQEHACALGDDGSQCAAELRAAIASQRAQHVTRQALGMEPDERRVLPGDVAVDESDRLGTAARI